MSQFKDAKFHCPVCGCPTEKVNKCCVSPEERLYECPDCKSVLQGIGRVWSIVTRGEPKNTLLPFLGERIS